MLLNSQGRIYLQKRSTAKEENAGLYDKTIGGHVGQNETPSVTIIKECAEELGIPVAVVEQSQFHNAVLSTRLGIIAIIKEIDSINTYSSLRILKDNRKYLINQDTKIYLGYYDGHIKFIDGKSSGLEVFSLDELKKEIESNPDKFTEDLKFMIKKYESLIKPIRF